MDIYEAVRKVSSKFKYKKDKVPIFNFLDYWFVMREREEMLKGDCDDFAITCMWEICDRSLTKFIWKVLIKEEYKIFRVQTVNWEYHIVGCVGDLWFDNWTRRPVDKETFFKITKHYDAHQVRWPIIMLYMLLGLSQR